jgi:hypothetical protein
MISRGRENSEVVIKFTHIIIYDFLGIRFQASRSAPFSGGVLPWGGRCFRCDWILGIVMAAPNLFCGMTQSYMWHIEHFKIGILLHFLRTNIGSKYSERHWHHYRKYVFVLFVIVKLNLIVYNSSKWVYPIYIYIIYINIYIYVCFKWVMTMINQSPSLGW